MTWQRLLLCFELQSPLHIGFLPNRPGTVLAPTRGYVPGKAMWGAITASLTPRLCSSPTAKQFQQVGEEIKRQIFFSYFYLSDGKQIFIPTYTQNGLNWGDLDDRAFRAAFMEARVCTRIEAQTGTAKDGSLHEIEFIRHLTGRRGEGLCKVLLIGAVWLNDVTVILGHQLEIRDDSTWCGDVELFAEVSLGGERNYGFGQMVRKDIPEDCQARAEALWKSEPDAKILLREQQPLLGHLPYRAEHLFFGDIEILAGREYSPANGATVFVDPGKHISNERAYFFAPGTKVQTTGEEAVKIDSWGRLAWQQ